MDQGQSKKPVAGGGSSRISEQAFRQLEVICTNCGQVVNAKELKGRRYICPHSRKYACVDVCPGLNIEVPDKEGQ